MQEVSMSIAAEHTMARDTNGVATHGVATEPWAAARRLPFQLSVQGSLTSAWRRRCVLDERGRARACVRERNTVSRPKSECARAILAGALSMASLECSLLLRNNGIDTALDTGIARRRVGRGALCAAGHLVRCMACQKAMSRDGSLAV